MTEHPAQSHPWDRLYPAGLAWNAPLPVERLDLMLSRTAARWPNRVALRFMDKAWSYAQVEGAVNRVAAGLQAMGYGRGSRIGLFLPNIPYFPIFYYGILRAGGVVVNFNPLYSDRELAHQAEDSGVTAMVTLDIADLFEKVQRVRASVPALARVFVCPMSLMLPTLKSVLFAVARRKDIASIPKTPDITTYESLTGLAAMPSAVTVDLERDAAVLQYTGGTTGVPKGAVLTHRNLRANTEQCWLWLTHAGGSNPETDPPHVVLGVLPFFHVFAMTACMNLAVRGGAEIELIPRIEMDRILGAIQDRKVTFLPAVPSLFQAIVDNKKRDKYDLTSLRYCISGGAPLPIELKKRFEAVTGCVLVEGYGLSETAPVTHINPLVEGQRSGSIGLPVPQTEIRFLSLEDDQPLVFLPPGERGEICLKGPQVMQGYWNNAKANAESFVEGFFRTGDIGYLDEDGFTYIVDRKKDLIILGGYKVYPRVVEEALYQHPDIEEAVVGGVADQLRGEQVKAWIKLREGRSQTPQAIKDFLKDRVSALELPRLVEIRTEPLPKTLVGKLSRKMLIEQEKASAAAQG